MVTVTVKWVTSKDDKVCPICRAIDGYVWTFENEIPESLIHPDFGEVWNEQMGSLAHEHQVHKGSKYGLFSSCRCKTENKLVSLKDLADLVRQVKNDLKSELGIETAATDTISGNYRRTRPEDIGIDLSQYGIE